MASQSPTIYYQNTSSAVYTRVSDTRAVRQFHDSLPDYEVTPLLSLSDLAKDVNVKQVLLKDESRRFGLPSFKILGASWGAFRAVTAKLELPPDSSLEKVKTALRAEPIDLYAATDGNHGQAVAFIAALLRAHSFIYVPQTLDQNARDAIVQQGGTVIEHAGNYDDTVMYAWRESERNGGLLVQDTSYEGYEEIPVWIVEGYSTMFTEIREQVKEPWPDNVVIITPAGVGSLAHAVVKSCKMKHMFSRVVTVEPETAACVHWSLRNKAPTSVKTSFTIMTGMDCGTVSFTAFEDLKAFVDASVTVSDCQAHKAVQYLTSKGIQSGPCGAAGIAALRRLAEVQYVDPTTTVILLNTESNRAYPKPEDAMDD